MSTILYRNGYTNTLDSLGITKTAALPLLTRAGAWVASKAPSWGKWLAEAAIGAPKQFGKEVLKGTALAPGSLIRKSFHTPTLFDKAIWYGFPAYDAYRTLTSRVPTGVKAEQLGGLAGGAALGMAAFRPLGMLGVMGGGLLGHLIGSGAVRGARHILPSKQPRFPTSFGVPTAPSSRMPQQLTPQYATPQYSVPRTIQPQFSRAQAFTNPFSNMPGMY